MATHWTHEKTFAYRLFTRRYIAGYAGEIDCADLALTSLVEYAYESTLPLRLMYYDHSWKTYDSASRPDNEEYKRLVARNMGALNVIDSSHAIPIADASAGDLIMSRLDSRLGHTRIIYEITPIVGESGAPDHDVVWFQGNLPPVVPQRRHAVFSSIEHVYGEKPRRWSFDAFDR